MITKNQVREAKIAITRAAGIRWNRRRAQRDESEKRLDEGGAGAADSLERQLKFAARESVRATAALRHRQGALPAALERIIGPTIDLIQFPPSEAARSAGKPVARIVVLPGAGLEPEGIATGFLVTPRLLLTNWHVLPSRDSALGLGANLLHEQTERGVQVGSYFELRPADFYLSNEAFDFALVGIDRKSSDGRQVEEFGTIRLIEATPKILTGQPVNIIQHPEGGPKTFAVSDNRLLDVLEDGFLHYTTDTLPGASGSPAFNQFWELVALHHSGVPEMRGDEIWSRRGIPWDPEKMNDDEVNWVANEGARVSAIVAALSRLRLAEPGQQELLDELLKTTNDPLESVAHLEGGTLNTSIPLAATAASQQAMTNHVFNFTGPVTIHIQAAPEAAPAAVPSAAVAASMGAQALEKVIRFDPNYDAKEGYKDDFLRAHDPALRVPVPKIVASRMPEIFMDHSHPNDPYVLKYRHYSLVMNKARRLLMWSAVNVEYSPALRDERSRKELGTDKWILDPRIPAKFQMTDPEFYQPAGRIDRGHIVRREDSAWGESPDDLEFSNSDTFHWTNCTPQHILFNQEHPKGYPGRKGLWGEFEMYLQNQLLHGEERCCILAGPVLLKTDPAADFGSGKIQYPIQFWKVIVVAGPNGGAARKLQAYGFIFSQADVVQEFGIEFVPGRFARFQKKLTAIADLAGVEFDPVLIAADTK